MLALKVFPAVAMEETVEEYERQAPDPIVTGR
jgi:hypothetical protein